MANIKKSFNFRNGVQVDEDNLLVTSTGLVAIGKTVPTEALDVIGNVIISGVTSSVFTQTGVLTVTTVNPTEIIGAGVSVVSGVVTSNSGSGIVTYYGDARFLQGMPTSQWQDTNAGFGVSSIYNTGGTVGIATTNPQSTLQVGNDPFSSGIGVGIASAGNIRASGTITATTLVGAVTGNVTGDITGNITGDVTGNLTGLVNSAGISTFAGINATGRIVGAAVSNVIPFFYSNFSDLPSPVTYHGAFAHVHSTGRGYYAHGGAWIELVNKDTSGNVALGKDLDVDGHTNLDNVSVAGVTTFASGTVFTGAIDANGDLDVDGHTNLDNVSISGVTTFAGAINADGGANIDNVQIGVTNDNEIDTSTGNLTIDSAGGTTTIDDDLSVTGQITSPFIESTGAIKAASRLESQLIGVGTDNPANFIHVRQNGDTEIQVTSDTGTASVTVGREPAVANTNNAEFRYGLVSTGSPYSSAQSLDIINYGTDNFNYFLSGNNPGGVNGDFHWHKGFNTARLMTLTGIGGSLGIGVTTPTEKLDVFGNANISSSLQVGGNANIVGSLTVTNLNANLTGNVIGNLTGNVTGFINSTNSGISTIQKLESNNVGIGTTDGLNALNINANSISRVFVTSDGRVGVGTDSFSTSSTQIDVELRSDVYIHRSLAVGSVSRSAIDFSDVVNVPDATGVRAKIAYMIPPKVTTAQRDVFYDGQAGAGSTVSGAVIFNTSISKLQVYTGNAWENLH
tara:strand:+ start:261 stop:2474 length:2214 start_codon:yes stop_codon:yes gene_type:complete